MLAPDLHNYAKIRVVGVGGGGCNAVSRMIEAGIRGVEYLAMNTDLQALDLTAAEHKLQLGANVTRGLGAGGNPEIGRQAAEESKQEIMMALDGSDMVFITCGMGGGTGTGGSPIVAEVSRSLGALTVAVVTKPFTYEGPLRMRQAEAGIKELRQHVDALIVIPNDRLFAIADRKMTLVEAFRAADDVLRQGVQGIAEVIAVPALINLDFADVRAVMENAGRALMGIGTATGDTRAADAAKAAVSSPLLETSIEGARAVLFNITGGPDLSLAEVHEAAQIISEAAGSDQVDVYLGAAIDEAMDAEVRVTVVATGFGEEGVEPERGRAAESEEEKQALADSLGIPPLQRRPSKLEPPRPVPPPFGPPPKPEPAPPLSDQRSLESTRRRRTQPDWTADIELPSFLRRPPRIKRSAEREEESSS